MDKELTLEQARSKFGEKNVRKIFDIQIRSKLYSIYSIEGYEHNLGKDNGCPAMWWLDYSDYEPEEDGSSNGEKFQPLIRELIPYIDKGVHRICWEVNYRQFNSTKYKWDEWRISKGGVCTIKANGKDVYKFHYSDLSGALSEANSKINDMMYHPFDFINPEKERGRKIWYYGLPATIQLGYEVGEIKIYPDYSYLDPNEWWDELEKRKTPVYPKDKVYSENEQDDEFIEKERFEETKDYGSINHGSVFYDGMINWFRND